MSWHMTLFDVMSYDTMLSDGDVQAMMYSFTLIMTKKCGVVWLGLFSSGVRPMVDY